MRAAFIIVQILFATRRILKIGQNHWDISQSQQGHVRSCDAVDQFGVNKIGDLHEGVI